jgi:hypothetical protein
MLLEEEEKFDISVFAVHGAMFSYLGRIRIGVKESK